MKFSTFIIIGLLFFLSGCKQPAYSVENQSDVEASNYKEAHRPQFHFSPEKSWMNDPNGMVYFQGEYHLFYQYYPDSTVWGPMHWGHAVSKDLVHWDHLPIALYPDSLGYIFSGSAVVDWENSSGFGTNENPPLVAIFTYHHPEIEKSGSNKFQYQGIAFSLDKGRSWTKYENNPVLENPGIRDFRDPKVIWYEPEEKWIMTLAAYDHLSFYSSKDLKSWKFESDFGLKWGSHAGVWECPDLIPMEVEETNEEKWVLLVSINPGGPQGGSATQYFVGDFDGNTFSLDPDFKEDLGFVPEFDPQGELFEDFESGYHNWTVQGDAFGKVPANGTLSGQQIVEGFKGKALVNSFFEGDITTGQMESQPFTITKPYINFRIGGGNHLDHTYIALLEGDKMLRKATGKNAEQLNLNSWDVSDFVGKEVRIMVVDKHTSGWGHINVDEIKFSNEEARAQKEKAIWLDYGADNYAGVSWSDVKDGRTLFIGWMNNWQYANLLPSEKWRGAMTLPRELSLHRVGSSFRIFSNPVEEIKSICERQSTFPSEILHEAYMMGLNVTGDFELILANELDEKVRMKLEGERFTFDRTQAGKSEFSPSFKASHTLEIADLKKFRAYIDVSSIELFFNDGEMAMTELVFPNQPYNKIEYEGNVSLESFDRMKFIWGN